MILAAIVIALLLDQIRPRQSGHALATLSRRWIDAVAGRVDASGRRHAWLAWVLAVAAPAIAAGLIGGLCTRIAGWFGQLAWTVAGLYFTLGFRQFSHYYTAIRGALAAGDETQARQLLMQWHGAGADYSSPLPSSGAGQGSTHDWIARRVIVYAVLSAHRCVFGVLFWFCLLAPLDLALAGAVLYRQAELAARYWRQQAGQDESVASPALLAAAQAAWRVIDWLPVRATALVFAVVGNFEDAIAAWRQCAADDASANNKRNNDVILLAAAAGALGIDLDGVATVPGASKEQPAVPASLAAAIQTDTDGLAYPPDWEPTAPSDKAKPTDAAAFSSSLGVDPDARHFTQVVGLLWRGVALWLLLLTLLTLAHVLG